MINPTERLVRDGDKAVTALAYEAPGERLATLLLAHGAGAGQRSPFMVRFASNLAPLGLRVVTFNFLYTEERRKLPDRRPVLERWYRTVIESVRADPAAGGPLFIGGKSMGGRIATHIAAEEPRPAIDGLVLLGYPLHPPGRPAERRDAHLPAVRLPMLVVQGSRDAFGTPAELEPVLVGLAPRPELFVVEGGDHSFKVPRSTQSAAEVERQIQEAIVAWIRRISAGGPGGTPPPPR